MEIADTQLYETEYTIVDDMDEGKLYWISGDEIGEYSEGTFAKLIEDVYGGFTKDNHILSRLKDRIQDTQEDAIQVEDLYFQNDYDYGNYINDELGPEEIKEIILNMGSRFREYYSRINDYTLGELIQWLVDEDCEVKVNINGATKIGSLIPLFILRNAIDTNNPNLIGKCSGSFSNSGVNWALNLGGELSKHRGATYIFFEDSDVNKFSLLTDSMVLAAVDVCQLVMQLESL